MKTLVVDASVAVKWFFPEIHSVCALDILRSDCQICAPDLVWSEVSNVIWKRWRRKQISRNEGSAIIYDLIRFPLKIHASDTLAPIAWGISTQTDQSFYDSLYLALAIKTNCRLITADRKFFEVICGTDFKSNISWIEEKS